MSANNNCYMPTIQLIPPPGKTTKAGELAEDICHLHGLEQHVHIPTRGPNTLDLILSDFPGNVTVTGHPPLGASDHICLLAIIPAPALRERPTKRTVWRYQQADWDRLRHSYRTSDWESCFTENPDQSCEYVSSRILSGMKQFIPSRILVTRPTDPSWWTPECSDAVSAKQLAWKQMSRSPSPQHLVNARQATRACATRLQRAQALHTAQLRQRLASGNMTDKQWWSTIKRAGGVQRNSNFPTITGDDGKEHVLNHDKANCFAQYFASKCSLGQNDLTENNTPATRQRTQKSIGSVHFRPATVRRELRRLNSSKAIGPDNIPARVLKECADALCKPLSRLFSLCYAKGRQPALWKTARVVPIHKKKSKAQPNNYRPISLLSIISKVMEAIVNRTIVNFLEKEDLLSAHQFGFRRKLGTSDLLTLLQHEWSSAIASHGAVHALAIDIAGAFDKVAHRGVLAKAQACGITGTLLAWLQDYLKDRSLQAVICGQQSAQYPISAGVPQGSILGPTLFILYVNDCADHLPGGPSLAVYADDTTLYKCITCIGDIRDSSTQLQSAVDAVAAWGQSWKIQFEPTKSQALTLSCHRPPLVLPPISFNNVPVAEEDEIRLLGVLFDRQLSFRSHLRSIASKANQRMHFFKKVAPLLNVAGKLCLYKGFVRPTMEYSFLTWMGASESSLKQLDRVQHRALRLIGPGAVLPHLSHRRMVGTLCYMYKLHCIPPSHPVASLLPGPAVAAPNPRTRRSSIARHPHQLQHDHPARTASWNLRRFPNAASKAWNVLPPSLLQHRPELKRLQAFKNKVNRHLLHSNWLAATDSL